jgi:UDP-N-acetylmuramoylalanine--D-glutamate ligase
MKMAVLGGGESGIGTALLGKVNGYEVFVSDNGIIADSYKQVLINNDIQFDR